MRLFALSVSIVTAFFNYHCWSVHGASPALFDDMPMSRVTAPQCGHFVLAEAVRPPGWGALFCIVQIAARWLQGNEKEPLGRMGLFSRSAKGLAGSKSVGHLPSAGSDVDGDEAPSGRIDASGSSRLRSLNELNSLGGGGGIASEMERDRRQSVGVDHQACVAKRRGAGLLLLLSAE